MNLLKRQNKVQDGFYRMDSVDKKTFKTLKKIAENTDSDIFDNTETLDAWFKLGEDLLTYDKELLIDETMNYLIDSVPEPYMGLFKELYRVNRNYIMSGYTFDEYLTVTFEVEPDNFRIDFPIPDTIDRDNFKWCFYNFILFPASFYITELVHSISLDLDKSFRIYVFEVKDGELVGVYLNKNYFKGEYDLKAIM